MIISICIYVYSVLPKALRYHFTYRCPTYLANLGTFVIIRLVLIPYSLFLLNDLWFWGFSLCQSNHALICPHPEQNRTAEAADQVIVPEITCELPGDSCTSNSPIVREGPHQSLHPPPVLLMASDTQDTVLTSHPKRVDESRSGVLDALSPLLTRGVPCESCDA
jgi:hypothetical protein